MHNLDIGRIPITVQDYLKLSKNLAAADMDSLVSPTDIQNEDDGLFLNWYDKLYHLRAKPLLKLSEEGNISKRMSRVFKQKHLPVCTSCIFGQAHRKP